jgi:TPR repeat protein
MSRANGATSNIIDTPRQPNLNNSTEHRPEGFAEIRRLNGSLAAIEGNETALIDGTGSVYDLKLAADQGDAKAQFRYGLCLHNGEGISIDFRGAAHYFKLAADQGHARAQFNYGFCLHDGKGRLVDFRGAAHYSEVP